MSPDDTFKYRESTEFAFSDAPVYRKTATLDKANVEVAATSQEVVTIINGKEETRNTAQPGDRIVTGPKGERYIIKQAKWDGLYEEDPADASRYVSKNVIRAIQLDENTELTAPWGEKQRVAKGGYVAQRVDNPADIYLIDEEAFRLTYALEKQNGPASSFAARVTSQQQRQSQGLE